MRRQLVIVLASLLLVTGTGFAHHSFSATYDTSTDADRPQKPQDGTDTRTLLCTPGADLVLFELAFRIKGEDADRLVLGQTGVSQVGSCGVGSHLRIEEGESEDLVCHS